MNMLAPRELITRPDGTTVYMEGKRAVVVPPPPPPSPPPPPPPEWYIRMKAGERYREKS